MKFILALRINKPNKWKSEDEVEEKTNSVQHNYRTYVRMYARSYVYPAEHRLTI